MTRRAHVGRVLAALALAWGVVLFAASLWLPASEGVGQECTITPGGQEQCRSFEVPGETLVEQAGYRALGFVSPPVLAAVVVLALYGAQARGRSWARFVVWSVIVLLWAYAFVTGFSIGLWLLPSAALLLASAVLAEQQRSRPVPGSHQPGQPL